VEIAFPAYIGRVNVVAPDELSCERDVTSETVGESSFAETRGSKDFAEEEVADTTWVYPSDERIFSNKGERISGTGSAYCGEVECKTEETPFNLSSKAREAPCQLKTREIQ